MLRLHVRQLCRVCYTEPLEAAPLAVLACGHLFHFECIQSVLHVYFCSLFSLSFFFTSRVHAISVVFP